MEEQLPIKYCVMKSYMMKKVLIITNTFQKILHELGRRPSKTWIDKSRGICNRSVKSWLQDNNIEFYLTHKENLLFLKDLLEPQRIKSINL